MGHPQVQLLSLAISKKGLIVLEVDDHAASEAAAIQEVRGLRGIAAEKWIAVLVVGRAAIGGQVAEIPAKTQVTRDVVFHTSTQAIGELGAAAAGTDDTGEVAVVIVSEAHAGGDVGT